MSQKKEVKLNPYAHPNVNLEYKEVILIFEGCPTFDFRIANSVMKWKPI